MQYNARYDMFWYVDHGCASMNRFSMGTSCEKIHLQCAHVKRIFKFTQDTNWGLLHVLPRLLHGSWVVQRTCAYTGEGTISLSQNVSCPSQ
jgi:hypothetical protein